RGPRQLIATPAAGALLRTGGPIGQSLRSASPSGLATVGNDRAVLASAGLWLCQRFDCLLRRLLTKGGQFLGLLADRRGALVHVRAYRLDEVRRRPDRHQLLRQLHVGLGVRLKGLQKLRLVFLYRLERTREGAAIEVGGVCELGRHAIADFGRSRGRVIVVRSHVFSSTQALQRRSVHRGVPSPYRSTHIATPMPPPTHRVAIPFLAFRLCISYSRVVRMRAPEAPIGWP